MGGGPSKEDLLRGEQARINREYPVSLKFPGFWDNESAFLREKLLNSEIASNVPAGAEKLVQTATGLSYGGTVLKAMMKLVCESTESIKRALLMLEIREAIAQSAHSQVKAKMEVVKAKLESAQNEKDMASKENKLDSANTACYELLMLFKDEDFYLFKKPLAFAPFFVSFVSIYVVVLKAHYLITKSSQRKTDATRVLIMLKEVITRYQKKTSKARRNYVYMTAVPFSEGEIVVVDGFTKYELYIQGNHFLIPHIVSEIKEWYQKELEDTYSNYFDESLQMVDKVLKSL
ncbi:unnamed protein product [Caenorhabditis auriculariae]|uniref:Uncharacterized protein n=1 Tax=Caenorhabditis auriculariae TaxID=2777116 RepID=A0A8S1H6A1_9PELO|nr:unnamed protein product [Caenorhabditis auriculariae]